MAEKPLQILIIEDNVPYAELLKEMLSPDGHGTVFWPESAGSLSAALAVLAGRKFDAALLDLHLPDGNGASVCETVREASPDLAIVIVSGSTEEQGSAAECMLKGAQDYLVKGEFDRKHLWHSLRYAVRRNKIESDYKAAQHALVEANRKLVEKVKELDRLNAVMMGREERILEMKEEIKALKEQLQKCMRI